MIITALIISLILSFSLHIHFLLRYITEKHKKFLRGFVNTAILNILIAITLSITALLNPVMVSELNLKVLLWAISGAVMVIMLAMKIHVLKNIYRRAQLPENYHLNFFGKKVLHPTVVKQYEVVTFF
jgi:hypothetical protein